MKRALFVLPIAVIALLVLVLWPPNLVRELESRAVAGDWSAAMTLADWYDADAHFAWAGVGGEYVPVSLRVRRTFQRSEVSATFWSDAAFNLLVRAAEENDRRALFILGSGLDSQFGGRPYPNEVRRDDYLVRMLLSDGPDPELDGFVFRRLGSRNPILAESVRREADRNGLLWPTLQSARDAAAAGNWDRWMEVWAGALERDVPGARVGWIRERSQLLEQVDAGNGASVVLLERIRSFDRAHPAVGLLGA